MKKISELVVALETIEKLTGYKLVADLEKLADGVLYSGLPGVGLFWNGGVVLYIHSGVVGEVEVENCIWVAKSVLEEVGFGVTKKIFGND